MEEPDDLGREAGVQAGVEFVDEEDRAFVKGEEQWAQEGVPGPGAVGLLLPVEGDVPGSRMVRQLYRVLAGTVLDDHRSGDAEVGDPQQLLDPGGPRTGQFLRGVPRALVALDLRADHPEVAAEPVEQWRELRVVVRTGRGEQQCVRPRTPHELGSVPDPSTGPLEDIRPGGVAVEPFLTVTTWVAVQPLGLDAGGSELEAVRPADRVDDDVDLEEGGFALALGVQGEDLARDSVVRGPVRIGVEDRVAHVRHRGQHVRLAGGVGPENADQREDGDGSAAREIHRIRRPALFVAGRDEGQLLLVSQGPYVRDTEPQQHTVLLSGLRVVAASDIGPTRTPVASRNISREGRRAQPIG